MYSISWDLDGVLADYSTGIEKFGFKVDRTVKLDLNRSGTGHPLKREMYEAIKGTDFYENLPIMPGAVALFKETLRLDPDPIIVTAAPKFGATEEDYFHNCYWQGAAYAKRRWMEEVFLPKVHTHFVRGHLGPREVEPDRVPIKDLHFVCTTSARKWHHLHRKHGKHQVLIDDRIANVTTWAENGGCGLLHISPDLTRRALRQLEGIAAGLLVDDCRWEQTPRGGMLWKETSDE